MDFSSHALTTRHVTKFVIVNQQLLSAAAIMPPSGSTKKRLAVAKPAALSRKKPRSGQSPPATPTPPKGATPLSAENCLHQVPWDASHFLKPWILFDHVDPLPKFRRMPEDYDWSQRQEFVDEGDSDDDLLDRPIKGVTKPVFVYGYM